MKRLVSVLALLMTACGNPPAPPPLALPSAPEPDVQVPAGPKPLTGEALAKTNRDLYDRGRALVAKLAKVRAGLPAKNNVQKCPDEALKAKKLSSYDARVILLDEPILASLEAPGATLIDEKAPWGFLLSRRIFFRDVFKVAGEAEFDPKLGRRGLQLSMPSLERYKFVAVTRLQTKRWPVVKDESTFSGGFVKGWVMIADLETGETICQQDFEYQMKLAEFGVDRANTHDDQARGGVEGRFEEFVKVSLSDAVKEASEVINYDNWTH